MAFRKYKDIIAYKKAYVYSQVKIYPKAIGERKLKSFSDTEKQQLLKKYWYVYFKYNDSKPQYKKDMNRIKDFDERFIFANELKKQIQKLLKEGWSPINHLPEDQAKISESIDTALKCLEKNLAETSYTPLAIRVRHFKEWLIKEGLSDVQPSYISRKHILNFLDTKNVSPRSRNNYVNDIKRVFKRLLQLEVVESNPCDSIDMLRVSKSKYKVMKSNEVQHLFSLLNERSPWTLKFIKFFSYSMLRPVEVTRIKIKDIDFEDNTVWVKTKTFPDGQKKPLPQIALNLLPDLSQFSENDFLFAMKSPGKWSSKKKVDYFSAKFTAARKELSLSSDYSMYGTRHTIISWIYNDLEKEFGKTRAIELTMDITGHESKASFFKYAKQIHLFRADDWSERILNQNL